MMEAVEYSPDERYARYKEELGQGAYKTVYKAFDTTDALEVAWNKLHVDRLPAAEVAKVETEVSLLRAVSHRNIINLYAFWREPRSDGRPASMEFITELMASGTLKQYLKRSKSIKLRVIRRWCANLLDAIAYLHARSPPIMHRDLKCDNIFINGHLGEVKLGDLGLSRVKSRASASSCIGTPEFMAPELYEENYTEKVDIYSFGMCLLEMITREYPYSECSNAAQIYRKVTTGEPPRALTSMIDCDVKSVIASCLKREAHRPSAVELLEHPLFRNWSSDDGTLSNLALIRGTPECAAVLAAAPPSAFLPDGNVAAHVIAAAPQAALAAAMSPPAPPARLPSGGLTGSPPAPPAGSPSGSPSDSPDAPARGSPPSVQADSPPAAVLVAASPVAATALVAAAAVTVGGAAPASRAPSSAAGGVVPSPFAIALPNTATGVPSPSDAVDSMRVTVTDGGVRLPAAAYSADGRGTQKLQMGLQMPVRGEMKQIAFEFDPAKDLALQVAAEMVSEFHLDPSQTEALAVDITRQVDAARAMGLSAIQFSPAGVPLASAMSPPPQEVSELVRRSTGRGVAPASGGESQSAEPPPQARGASGRRRGGVEALMQGRSDEPKLRTSGSSASSHRAAASSPAPVDQRLALPSPVPLHGSALAQGGTVVHKLMSSDAGMARAVEKESGTHPPAPSAHSLTPVVVIESKPKPPRQSNATVTTPKANGLVSILSPGSASSRSTVNGTATAGLPASLALPTSITDAGAAAAGRPVARVPPVAVDGRERNKPTSGSHKSARTPGRRVSPPPEPPIPVVLISPDTDDVQRSTSRKVVPSKSHTKLKDAGVKEPKPKSLSRGNPLAGKAPDRPRPGAVADAGGKAHTTVEAKPGSSKSTTTTKSRPKSSFTVSGPQRPRVSNSSSSSQPKGLPQSASGNLAADDLHDDEFDGAHYALCMQLMNAAARGSRDLVLCKLEKGASAEFADYDRRTALHVASSNGHCAVAELLIEYGADLNARDRWGSTALADALKNEHPDLVKLLEAHGGVDENGESPSMRVESQSIQLMAMCARGSLARAANHLKLGALPNHADYDGRRPLHIACSEGHHEIVDLLLTAGASADVTDRFGNSPAQDAFNTENYECLRVLRQHGAPVPAFPGDQDDDAGTGSASGHDSEYDDSEVAVSDDTGSGHSEETLGAAVSRAAQLVQDAASGNAEAVRAYIAASRSLDGTAAVGVNFADYEGNTALHQACAKGHVEVVDALLEAGADVSVRDRWGLTPADQARASALPVTGTILSLLSDAASRGKGSGGRQSLHSMAGEEVRRPAADLTRSSNGSDAELLADASHVSSASVLFNSVPEQRGVLPASHAHPKAHAGLNRFPTLPSFVPSSAFSGSSALASGVSLYNEEENYGAVEEAATAAFLGSRGTPRHEADGEHAQSPSSMPRMDVKALAADSMRELGGVSAPVGVSRRLASDRLAVTVVDDLPLVTSRMRSLAVDHRDGAPAADVDADLARSPSDSHYSRDSSTDSVVQERAALEARFERQRQELLAQQEMQMQLLARTSVDGRTSSRSRGSRGSGVVPAPVEAPARGRPRPAVARLNLSNSLRGVRPPASSGRADAMVSPGLPLSGGTPHSQPSLGEGPCPSPPEPSQRSPSASPSPRYG